jgi:hypothetical protein
VAEFQAARHLNARSRTDSKCCARAAIALPRAFLAGGCYGGSLLARIASKACSAYTLRREWRAVVRAVDEAAGKQAAQAPRPALFHSRPGHVTGAWKRAPMTRVDRASRVAEHGEFKSREIPMPGFRCGPMDQLTAHMLAGMDSGMKESPLALSDAALVHVMLVAKPIAPSSRGQFLERLAKLLPADFTDNDLVVAAERAVDAVNGHRRVEP